MRKISSKNGNLEFVKHFVGVLSLTNFILSSQYLGNSGKNITAQKSISPHFSHEPNHACSELLHIRSWVSCHSLLSHGLFFSRSHYLLCAPSHSLISAPSPGLRCAPSRGLLCAPCYKPFFGPSHSHYVILATACFSAILVTVHPVLLVTAYFVVRTFPQAVDVDRSN